MFDDLGPVFGDDIVTWDGDVYTGWYSGNIVGTIDGDDMTWSNGWEWQKYEVGNI